MKKKISAILLCVALLSVVLCACGGSTNEEASNETAAADPTTLIVGYWYNAEADVYTDFSEDGICSTVQNGETVYSDTYIVEKVDDTSIIVTTGDGQTMEISFVDDNTFVYEGTTITRITEENQGPASDPSEDSAASPETLIIGTWAVEGSSIEFYEDGTAYTVDENAGTGEFTYELASAGDGTFTITLFDTDGTSSSEISYFVDNNTLVIGDSQFYRA